ncbi:hypothetical protein [Luteibacter yeojuensis]|uniref:hypothetical protein n=1 Tax=Luteibacter yeojuensis TaxID=345309 RepID=UPI0012ED1698|nr:hypothetical protein [Luteibacter yeojuensis]
MRPYTMVSMAIPVSVLKAAESVTVDGNIDASALREQQQEQFKPMVRYHMEFPWD